MRYTIIIEAKSGIRKVCENDKKLCDEACTSYQKEATCIRKECGEKRRAVDSLWHAECSSPSAFNVKIGIVIISFVVSFAYGNVLR
ncbi:hypothetical protein Ddc_14748 [Ditylenchus destructor]|nr:hypothetical protein Ddc_14748 [Ditylenchus destructor]